MSLRNVGLEANRLRERIRLMPQLTREPFELLRLIDATLKLIVELAQEAAAASDPRRYER